MSLYEERFGWQPAAAPARVPQDARFSRRLTPEQEAFARLRREIGNSNAPWLAVMPGTGLIGGGAVVAAPAVGAAGMAAARAAPVVAGRALAELEGVAAFHIPAVARMRPRNVPKDWIRTPSKRGNGARYHHPQNDEIYVRAMPRRPGDQFPHRRVPYVVYNRSGQAFDASGNPVAARSPGAHIARPRYDHNKMPGWTPKRGKSR